MKGEVYGGKRVPASDLSLSNFMMQSDPSLLLLLQSFVSLSFLINFIKFYDRIPCFYFALTGPTPIFHTSFGNKCYWIPFSCYIFVFYIFPLTQFNDTADTIQQ